MSDRGCITLDLTPYYYDHEDGEFVFEDFTAFDLRVPERYQNQHGGEYDKVFSAFERGGDLCECSVYMRQESDMTLYVTFSEDASNAEEELDALCRAFDSRYDAFTEIGWEGLEQSE